MGNRTGSPFDDEVSLVQGRTEDGVARANDETPSTSSSGAMCCSIGDFAIPPAAQCCPKSMELSSDNYDAPDSGGFAKQMRSR